MGRAMHAGTGLAYDTCMTQGQHSLLTSALRADMLRREVETMNHECDNFELVTDETTGKKVWICKACHRVKT